MACSAERALRLVHMICDRFCFIDRQWRLAGALFDAQLERANVSEDNSFEDAGACFHLIDTLEKDYNKDGKRHKDK